MYEITYDYDDDRNIRETFKGSWLELKAYISGMKRTGCYNITTADIEGEAETP